MNIPMEDMTESMLSNSTGREMSTSFILLSSTACIPISEEKGIRKRWSWFKYICFMVPLVWMSVIYVSQCVFGVSTLYQTYNGVYNTVSGVVGLAYISIQVADNWYYIKPASWITQYDVVAEKSYLWTVFVFIVLSILDMFLFLWSILGSILALTLVDAGDYNVVLTIFSSINIFMQWTKYGAFMFLLRLMARKYLL